MKVGGALVDIDAEGADAEEAPSPSPAAAAPSPLAPPPSASKSVESRRVLPSSGGANNVLASPAVRRLAKEKGVQLELVRGSGKNGLITREDVLAALEGGAAELATSVVRRFFCARNFLFSKREKCVPDEPQRNHCGRRECCGCCMHCAERRRLCERRRAAQSDGEGRGKGDGESARNSQSAARMLESEKARGTVKAERQGVVCRP